MIFLVYCLYSMSQRNPRPLHRSARETSWQNVSQWYGDYLKQHGTYQSDLVFPGVSRLLEMQPNEHLLDIACGEGSFLQTFARDGIVATGIDAASGLIQQAKSRHLRNTTFQVGDARALPSSLAPVDAASCILALQNIDDVELVFRGLAKHIKRDGRFVFVINHPCFRVPKHSDWGWDSTTHTQYRRVDRYASEYEVEITAHPGSAPHIHTYSYHRPLEYFVQALSATGFLIDALEEWSSHKQSDSGPRAREENRSRREIPLFLAIRARYVGEPERRVAHSLRQKPLRQETDSIRIARSEASNRRHTGNSNAMTRNVVHKSFRNKRGL